MITETRVLVIGVEHNGKIHTELVVGQRKVKHLIAASGDALFVQDNKSYEVCCLAAQILKLGDIPQDEINGTLLAEMDSDDFDVLTEAAEKVRQRTRSFRSDTGGQSPVDTGDAQTGLSPPGSDGNAGG